MKKLGSISVSDSSPVRIMGILNLSPESFYKKSVKTTRNEISKSVIGILHTPAKPRNEKITFKEAPFR